MKMILIDSGVDTTHPAILSKYIEHADTPLYRINPRDSIGHGTAIAFILQHEIPDLEIISYKLFDSEHVTEEREIIEALYDIYNHFDDVGIIVLSSGTNYLKSKTEFEKVCTLFEKKQIILLAGYDNGGSVSYPAAFDSVIGIYWNKYITNVHDFYYVDHSDVEILGYAGNQRLPWKNGTYKYVSGSSFVVPYIACIVEQYRRQNPGKTLSEVRAMLRKRAKKIFSMSLDNSSQYQKYMKEKISQIQKAIIFPCNKETDALIGNTDLLNFELCGIYDAKYSAKFDKKANEVIYGEHKSEKKIQRYDEIEWDSEFDTIIIGHLDIISECISFDYIEDILWKAYRYNKNIVSLDIINKYGNIINKIEEKGNFVINLQLPQIQCNINYIGSLHKIACPVIGVVGTGKQQGKYNVQLSLRRRFIRDGYDIGQLGTEPTAYLFGMDIAWPVGYGSNINQEINSEINYVNKRLFELSEKDIIIFGLQSQTIPYDFGNLGFLTPHQENILIAANPDCVILCVNYDDEIEYIERTIITLKNYYMTELIALCVYPIHKELYWNINAKKRDGISKEEEKKIARKLEAMNLPVFINGNVDDMEKLYLYCINYFARGGND